MEIIAESKGGFLISATTKEVEEILTSVHGTAPEKIVIGQRIPAIDYASTIRKMKGLKEEWAYGQLLEKVTEFNNIVGSLQKAVEAGSKLEG